MKKFTTLTLHEVPPLSLTALLSNLLVAYVGFILLKPSSAILSLLVPSFMFVWFLWFYIITLPGPEEASKKERFMILCVRAVFGLIPFLPMIFLWYLIPTRFIGHHVR